MFPPLKLITPFILPPVSFILLLLVSGTVIALRYRRKVCILNIAVSIILWVFSSAQFAYYLIAGLESGFHLGKHIQGDVIFLLGGGIIDDVPDFSGPGIPAKRMLEKLVTAFRL